MRLGLMALIMISELAWAGAPKWEVVRDQWTERDEQRYAQFIGAIYQAVKERKCGQDLYTCLDLPEVNPYRNLDLAQVENPKYGEWFDCGRCPIYLRAYFAYQNKLPFSHLSLIAPRGGRDSRYGLHGSRALKRAEYLHHTKQIRDLRSGSVISKQEDFSPWKKRGSRYYFVPDTFEGVNSGFFRFGYRNDYDNDSDLYPVPLNRETILPGVTWYEPNGHVAQVGKVDTNTGKVYLFNCHVDGSLSSELLSSEDVIGVSKLRGWGLDPAEMGGYLKRWRPIRLENYSVEGSFLVGGELKIATNEELKLAGLYSTEQYETPYMWNGTRVNTLEDYIRTKISGDLPKYQPGVDIKSGVQETCIALQDRVKAVNNAIDAGIHRNTIEASSTSGRLPENIYNTHHYEWEVYSTPSRDVAIKTQFVSLYELGELLIQLYDEDSPQLIFEGSREELLNVMETTYLEAASSCAITYTNSRGQEVNLTYEDFSQKGRLFGMSFDPYHCPERRWAAPEGSAELQTCPDSSRKTDWYFAEQNLRNQVFRDGERQDMDYSLRDLEVLKESDGNGWEQAPVIDFLKMIDTYR